VGLEHPTYGVHLQEALMFAASSKVAHGFWYMHDKYLLESVQQSATDAVLRTMVTNAWSPWCFKAYVAGLIG
jgi:hypothetical protein